MANDKREEVNAEKIYGHLCRTSKEEFISEFNVQEGGLTEEEVEQISKYINQYGEAMAKAIGERYYTM